MAETIMSKKISLFVACLASSVSVCALSSQELNQGASETKVFVFNSVRTANPQLISDDDCRKVMLEGARSYQVERDSSGRLSSVFSKNLKVDQLKMIYREEGLGVFSSKVYAHVWEGVMSFSYQGHEVVAPVIMSSIFPQGEKEAQFSFQSTYCNAIFSTASA